MVELLVFTAKWCKHCGGIDKALKSIAKVTHIDADDNFTLCDRVHIDELPTIVVLKDNKEVKRFIGETLVTEIEKYLKTLEDE